MTVPKAKASPSPSPLIWFWQDAMAANGLGLEQGKRDMAAGKLRSVMIRGRRMIRHKDLEAYIELLITEESQRPKRPQIKNLKTKAADADLSNIVSISGE